jgi:hypothetical protein
MSGSIRKLSGLNLSLTHYLFLKNLYQDLFSSKIPIVQPLKRFNVSIILFLMAEKLSIALRESIKVQRMALLLQLFILEQIIFELL